MREALGSIPSVSMLQFGGLAYESLRPQSAVQDIVRLPLQLEGLLGQRLTCARAQECSETRKLSGGRSAQGPPVSYSRARARACEILCECSGEGLLRHTFKASLPPRLLQVLSTSWDLGASAKITGNAI